MSPPQMQRFIRRLSLALGSAQLVACWPMEDLSSYSEGASIAALEPASADAAPPDVLHADIDDLPPNLDPTSASPSDSDPDARDTDADAGGAYCSGENEAFDADARICYWLSMNSASWALALGSCAAQAGHLVTIDSAREDDWLSAGFPITFWIGANDRAREGRFTWASGEPFAYANFDAGEPNNLFRLQDCVEKVAPGGRWNDRDCSVQNRFVCERAMLNDASR